MANLPFIVLLIGMGAAAMYVPAVFAYLTDDLETARAFLYSGLLFSFIFVMIALATEQMRIRRQGRSHLISMFSCLTVLPVMLAFPMAEVVDDTRFFNVYFEMISSLTTTGFTLFEPDRLPPAIHLWRGMVGWMGGFFVWVTALAILAPMNLGGFEISSQAEIGQGARQIVNVANPAQRLQRYAVRFLPIYGGLTGALWLALFVAGDTPLVALVHAMSTMSTSSISPIGGLENAASGQVGELVVFIFFIFALSRVTFLSDERTRGMRDLVRDPELRIGLLITVCVAGLLFLRHWVVSFDEEVSFQEAVRSLWGA
ncbi:MAG: TrkH family potassium uptake protein, partial [Pseudomonadota bacterium]